MSRYLAQVEAGVVVRVIVCDDPAWAAARLGGTWIETADPYSAEPQEVAYCGPGFGHDETFPERFAPQWQQPVATADGWTTYPIGALVWHNGRMWKSTTNNNVWEPGVSAWHDAPVGGGTPIWVAPTGSHDTYPLGFTVEHAGTTWESLIANNVWEPGSVGAENLWKNLSPPVEPDEYPAWKPWTGINADLYQVGAKVTHNGKRWVNTVPNSHWEPGVYGWNLIP
jgi:hypothetical protein